jgi:hypothetical protein
VNIGELASALGSGGIQNHMSKGVLCLVLRNEGMEKKENIQGDSRGIVNFFV